MAKCRRCSKAYHHRPNEDTILHGTCKGLCENCQATNYREYQRMYANRSRASGARLPSTLTLPQWIATVDYFNWMCAYCQVQSYTTIEHFIPISLGGGTTVSNCVPACAGCDGAKAKKHPDNVVGIPKEDIKRVHEYLTSFQKS